MPGESITFTVRGTFKSEFRARFWATRLTYSLMTGSVKIFADLSIWEAYSVPIAVSFSSEIMLRWATRRFPTSLTSVFLLSPARTGRAEASKSRLNANDLVARRFIGRLLQRRSNGLYIHAIRYASNSSTAGHKPRMAVLPPPPLYIRNRTLVSGIQGRENQR